MMLIHTCIEIEMWQDLSRLLTVIDDSAMIDIRLCTIIYILYILLY